MLYARLIKVSIYNPYLGGTFSSGYVLSSGTVSSLIASLGFISIIDDTVLFILFTILYKFLTQIVGQQFC